MNDQIWYVYQQGQQLGPFETPQILQMVSSSMIAQDAYLFKVGWKDWRPIEDSYEELGLPPSAKSSKPERRMAAPRASIKGRVIVHNSGQLAIGAGVNISSTGIFVETKEELFTVGEKLKLSVRVDGMTRPFNVEARVIRFNSDPKMPMGYGLQFEGLAEDIRKDIDQMVNEQNNGQAQKQGMAR